MWGPDLVMVYNDAYAPMLGARHPSALGAPGPEVWADVWADIEPMVDDVFAGGTTYYEDLPLMMTRRRLRRGDLLHLLLQPGRRARRRGRGPAQHRRRDDPRVLAARRMGVLQQLGSLPRSVHGSSAEAVAAALQVLAEARTDCPFGARLPHR